MSPDRHALDDCKSYSTLAAQFALVGRELHCELGIDGIQRICVIHNGLNKSLADLDAARAYLVQMGGSS